MHTNHTHQAPNASFISPFVDYDDYFGSLHQDHDGTESGTEDISSSHSTKPFHYMNVFYGIIFTFGVPANLFIVVIVVCYKRIKVVTNVYILNLALADLLSLAWVPLYIYKSHVGEWLWGLTMCKLFFMGTTVNQFGSVAFLAALSLDRYLAICHPIRARKLRTIPVAVACSVGCWAIVLVLMTPIYMYSTTVNIVPYIPEPSTDASTSNETEEIAQLDGEIQCMIFWPVHDLAHSRTPFTLYMFSLAYVVPLVIIWSFYGTALFTLYSRVRSLPHRSRQRRHRKVTAMVFSVVIAYTLCWAPFWIVQMLIEFLDVQLLLAHERTMRVMSLSAYCLQTANSLLNPILYCFVSGTYMQIFADCFRKAKAKVALRSEFSSSYSMNKRRSTTLLQQGQNGTMAPREEVMMTLSPSEYLFP